MKTTLKKTLSMFLALIMILSAMIVPAWADASSSVTVKLVGKDGGTATTLATWNYDSANETYTDQKTGNELAIVTDFSSSPLIYTGLNKKPDPRCLSVTLKGIKLEDLFDYAEALAGDINLRGDTAMYISDAGGFFDEFTYEQYWGLDRYCYMNWYNQTTYASTFSDWSDGEIVPSTLMIKGYHATAGETKGSLVTKSDTEKSLRISVGQQKNGNTSIADSWVHTGNNRGSGDINEGNLSVNNISEIKFTPNYKTISVVGGVANGTSEGAVGYSVSASNAAITTSDNWFKAAGDEIVTFSVTPDSGYNLDSVTVKKNDESVVSITELSDGVYKFKMPSENVKIEIQTSNIPTSTTTWYGDGTASEFTINTAEDLAGFADKVNGGTSFAGKTVKLGADINLSGYSNWTPIGTITVDASGNVTTGNAFSGTFDGNNKTISNLSAKKALGGVALFGYSNGTIKDVTVSGIVKGKYHTAGVVAYASGAISGVTNSVEVTAAGENIGGIVATCGGDITISACHNTANIKLGVDSSDQGSGRMAGIIGCVESDFSANISECSNTGNISGYQYTGGIVGAAFGNVSVDACYNAGTLTNISWGMTYLGGIVGKLENGTVSNCYNIGQLNHNPWGAGHLRAVGGIVGCEQNHALGTAITNCYNAGTIEADTSHMTEGSNYIYMYGNISGGNNKSDANTMSYSNCVYLEGSMPIQSSSHLGYKFWADGFKSNNKLYDTAYVISKTETELKNEAILTTLGTSFKIPTGGGYPVLYWQTSAPAPTAGTYAVNATTSGGIATITVNSTAVAGNTVDISVSGVESGKQIKRVCITDASGANIPVTGTNGSYSFTMPSRKVNIVVILENTVETDAESFDVTLPTNLDGIWQVKVDGTYYNAGKAKAGSTVTIVVEKEQQALTSSFNGVTVTSGSAVTSGAAVIDVSAANEKTTSGAKWYGEYTFTMPSTPVTVSLNETYSNLKVYSQTAGVSELKATLTRADVRELGENNQTTYFSGWSTENDAFVGKATSYVTLAQILTGSGITFEQGDKVIVKAVDGFTQTFTYENLIGTPRYYYSDIFTNGKSATSKTTFAPIFTIEANFASSETELSTIACDTLYAYRFVYGQTENELQNGTKIVDSMPQCVVEITIEKAPAGAGGNTQTEEQKNQLLSDMDLTSSIWDGKSIDVSWYIGNENSSGYYINTAAKLAGVSALVNGLVNDNCKVYAGDKVYTAAEWNSSNYVNSASGSSGGSHNKGTTSYSYGVTRFKDQSIYIYTDLDMSGGNWMPIGGSYLMKDEDTTTKVSGSFCGIFNGNYHSITIKCDRHCTVNLYDGSNIGLIGRLGASSDDPSDWQPNYAGVCNLAIYGSVKGNRSVGGVVGKIDCTKVNATIEGCANFASITGTDAKGTGGIVGASWNSSVVKNCYNAGEVKNTGKPELGGISGSNEGAIENCFNVGKVTGVGTIASIATANSDMSTYTNCHWLEGTASCGVYNKDIGEAKTSAEMKSETFIKTLGSAFTSDTNRVNNGYPVLSWQSSGSSSSIAEKTAEELTANIEASIKNNNDGTVSITFTNTDTKESVEKLPASIKVSFPVKEGSVVVLVDKDGNEKIMPKCVVEDGKAYIVVDEAVTVKVIDNKVEFSDVEEDAWYKSAIDFASSHGLFSGVSATEFEPNSNMTRGMLVTVIHRLESEIKSEGSMDFGDVPSDAFYKDAVAWANANKIVEGYDSETFGANDNVTREQMAVILYRYAKYVKMGTSEKGALDKFSDSAKVSSWSKDAMEWAVGAGIIAGRDNGIVDPTGTASRAEVAAMLQRLVNLMVK